MFPYIPITPDEEKEMLSSIGLNSVDQLFSDIPDEIKLKRKLNINDSLSEIQVRKILRNLSDENKSVDSMACFLGAGAYDHYIPAVVNNIISRSEYYTAYTPYQAEISQGTLQTIFEYQSMICELTGMDASNASMYDGATACAEAAILSCDSTRKKKILVSETVNPEIRSVLKTYLKFKNIQFVEIKMRDGITDADDLNSNIDKDTAGVIVQNPNFFGIIEELEPIEKITHDSKAILTVSVDPISLGILKTPGEYEADIAVGEAQSLGNSLSFGGPYIGFMAVNGKLTRKMPGRIVGQTEDKEGKRAFVLTLQAREQHIRRQKASSNICSNEALNALASAVYLTTMGKQGIRDVAYSCTAKAHYTYNKLIESGKFTPVFNKPFFNEFAIKSASEASSINNELLKNNIIGGYDLSTQYAPLNNTLLLCVTEKRSKDEIHKLIEVMEGVK
ncbi:MAG: hypothetical protein K0R54_3274 [Clostridiaceae bacterium]|jgi:glycine dehydrogenase subunit 1|nr:hypothetical protein [Clostridiaceae bacterium]